MWIPLSQLSNSSVQQLMRQWIHRNNWRIVGLIVFYAVCVVSMESRQFVLPRTSGFLITSILKNSSVHIFRLPKSLFSFSLHFLIFVLGTSQPIFLPQYVSVKFLNFINNTQHTRVSKLLTESSYVTLYKSKHAPSETETHVSFLLNRYISSVPYLKHITFYCAREGRNFRRCLTIQENSVL